jgi:2'-5' RNA ligase
MTESAIILPVPDAEPIVADVRARHDPAARLGVPAHITLLYPFTPPLQVAESTGTLERLFAGVRAFSFALSDVRRFPTTVYLHPEPVAAFIELIAAVARRWPEFPPYRGAFPTVIPHLTIADREETDILDRVQRAVATRLPIRCRATEVWLMCSDEIGKWSRRNVFPLGRAN